MEIDEAGTMAALYQRRSGLIEPTVEKHLGHIVKTMDDEFRVELGSVVEAVPCAIDPQSGLNDHG